MNTLKQITTFTKIVKTRTFSFIFLLALGFLSTSCNSEDTIDLIDTDAINQKAFETQAEVQRTNDGINAIVEDFYYNEEIIDTRQPNNPFLPDCAVVTTLITSNNKLVTIDFGSSCELNNGNILSGIIEIEYNRIPNELTKTIAVTFIDFYFNDKNISGHKTIERTAENSNGNPQSTITTNITVTWQDASFASSQGTRTREWVEGVDSGFWGDNVYLITGNWTFVRKNGTVLSGIITTTLRRELACRFIVSGVVELSKNNNVATLNYGDGSCDNIGVITINGDDHEINLRH